MNKHQHGTFEDVDHDLIEDYSVNKELEDYEKLENSGSTSPGTGAGAGNGGVASMFGGVDHPDGYSEDKVDAEGHHTKKTVHKGDGWESVSIESDVPLDIGDIGGIIGQMLQAQQMRGLQQLGGNSPFM